MGASSDSERNNTNDLEDMPNDQYSCTECKLVPEIKEVDFNEGKIKLKCKKHPEKTIGIKEYFRKESKFLYHNIKCDNHNRKVQRKYHYIFNHFPKTKENLCKECTKDKENEPSVKINEVNDTCLTHFKKYTQYCKECDWHYCDKDNKCEHSIEKIKKPKQKNKELIRNIIDILEKRKEIIDYLIKFLKTIITTYEKHPSNYKNYINVENVAKDLEKNTKEYLLTKIKMLEDKILNILNLKLDVNISRKQIKLSLNGKKLQNIDVNLLALANLKNLQDLDLSNNNISNIEELKYFNSDTMKKINLSFNQINNIEPLKNLSKLQTIDLQVNKISNIKPLNDIFDGNKELKSLNLDGNQIKKEDFINIKIPINLEEIICGGKNIRNELEDIEHMASFGYNNYPSITYEINSNETKIRLFGKNFIDKNRDKFRIIINDNQNDLIEYYTCKENEYRLKINIIATGDIIDVSEMFYECTSLFSIDRLFDSETKNIINMSKMFYGCSSLKILLGISEWKTEKVNNMSEMFSGCSS